MNYYKYEQLEVGMQESFQVTVTEEMMKQFGTITGDFNPLHTDEQFAKQKGYDGKVVYGMLTASFLSALAGMYLPGEKSLIHRVEVEFPKPVYVGDTLTVTGKITSMNEAFQIFEMKVTVTNQDQVKVLRGKMRIQVLGENESK